MNEPSATYQVMPALTPEEYETLKADIQANGVQVAVEVDEEGNILDGYHRAKICQELGGGYPKNVRAGLSEEEKIDFAIRINLNRRQLSREQRQELSLKLRRQGWSYRKIGEALKVGVGTVHRDVSVVPIGTPNYTTGKDNKQYPAAKDPEKVEHYTKAVEEFPELKVLPINQAIQAAENLRQMPLDVQKEKLALSREAQAKGEQRQRQIDEDYKSCKRISNLISLSLRMQGTVTEEAIEAWLQFNKERESIANAVSNLDYGITELTILRDKLSEIMRGPRKVARK